MPYIYILSNKAMPGLVKIGSTALSPVERASQLSTTGVPQPFIVEEYWEPRCEDILVLERKVHSHLKQWRIASNREFFLLSVDDAVEKVNGFFQLQGELERKREQRLKAEKEKRENLEQVAALRRRLDEVMIGQIKEVIDAFKANSHCLSEYLNDVANPHATATIVRRQRPDDHLGKLREAHGWFVEVEQRKRGWSNRRRRNYSDYGEVVNLFVSVSFSSFMKGVKAAPKYISVSYFLRNGELANRGGDRNIINSHFGEDAIPDSLAGLLKQAGARDIYAVWGSTYGQASKLKAIVDERSACPVCEDGRLIRRTRRKDGHPFLGCSGFPNCRFTFDYYPAVSCGDWEVPASRCEEKKEKASISSGKNKADSLDDLNDILAPALPVSQVNNNDNEQEGAGCHNESGGFSWWYIFWMWLAIKFILLLIKEIG